MLGLILLEEDVGNVFFEDLVRISSGVEVDAVVGVESSGGVQVVQVEVGGGVVVVNDGVDVLLVEHICKIGIVNL